MAHDRRFLRKITCFKNDTSVHTECAVNCLYRTSIITSHPYVAPRFVIVAHTKVSLTSYLHPALVCFVLTLCIISNKLSAPQKTWLENTAFEPFYGLCRSMLRTRISFPHFLDFSPYQRIFQTFTVIHIWSLSSPSRVAYGNRTFQ